MVSLLVCKLGTLARALHNTRFSYFALSDLAMQVSQCHFHCVILLVRGQFKVCEHSRGKNIKTVPFSGRSIKVILEEHVRPETMLQTSLEIKIYSLHNHVAEPGFGLDTSASKNVCCSLPAPSTGTSHFSRALQRFLSTHITTTRSPRANSRLSGFKQPACLCRPWP